MIKLSGYLYTCSAGDTFDKIALDVYQDEKYAAELMTANPEYTTTAIFTGGEVLSLPVVIVPENRDNPRVPITAPWKE